MWSLINSLQIILILPFINLVMPANVYLVLTNLDGLSSLDVLQAGAIISSIFTFSPTETIGPGFSNMGVESKRLIPYLGSFFLFLMFDIFLLVLYAILYFLRNKSKYVDRIQQKLAIMLFWNKILILQYECYLDYCIGSLLSYEQLNWVNLSDYVDSCFTILVTPIAVGLSFFILYFLMRHIREMQVKESEEKVLIVLKIDGVEK